MWRAIDMAITVQSVYKFAARKLWISAFRGKKQNSSILSGSTFIAKGIPKSC
jgi:hypothetical protein